MYAEGSLGRKCNIFDADLIPIQIIQIKIRSDTNIV